MNVRKAGRKRISPDGNADRQEDAAWITQRSRFRLHYEWAGKLETVPKMAVRSKEDLSLAYTPGVAQPCLEIQRDINKSYELTGRHNLVAVITDGTAVLGLGDIGPEAGMPVMEGKMRPFQGLR